MTLALAQPPPHHHWFHLCRLHHLSLHCQHPPPSLSPPVPHCQQHHHLLLNHHLHCHLPSTTTPSIFSNTISSTTTSSSSSAKSTTSTTTITTTPTTQQHNQCADWSRGCHKLGEHQCSMINPLTLPMSATLLIPQEDSLNRMPNMDPFIVPYHIVPQRLSFSDLQLIHSTSPGRQEVVSSICTFSSTLSNIYFSID
ncbi:hypothetical protein SLA2020_416790 [Shorea laevis]